jgi:hypothetical protein
MWGGVLERIVRLESVAIRIGCERCVGPDSTVCGHINAQDGSLRCGGEEAL